MIEARAVAWHLAGYEGNTRGVINREHFRVLAVRPDGGLEVGPVDEQLADGEGRGARLVLPPEYVAEHLALGYASTVHAAQGATVDTTHTVVTARTGPAALYVGMSRGRDANTAHVATITSVDDPAQGTQHEHSLHRDPVAMLARILDTTEHNDAANRSAVATASDAATRAGSARTAAELLADAAQLAATERTTAWLDQLVDNGALTAGERSQIAAEDGSATLTRILRRTELAGHDPRQVLYDAVTASSFEGARNLANVLYSRIRSEYEHQLDPVGESFADWVPQVDNSQWAAYLNALAAAADQRADQLGHDAADAGSETPGWAVEAFGPVPAADDARAAWARDVGRVAAYREIHGTDTTDALDTAPGSGQVEAYAAYRAAWRALGRPDTDRDVMEMTDGQLRIRVRAAQREETWGPRYVANELVGTRQAAAAHRHTASLRTAQADATTEPAERERLRGEAGQASALAETLDARAEQLQFVDNARARFLVDTAVTRADGAHCAAELGRRHVDDTEPEARITADEWLAAYRDTIADDDVHRDITETDLHDDTTMREDIERALDETQNVLELPQPDIREIAEREPVHSNSDRVRVTTPQEAADWTDAACRSLAEITARHEMDTRREEAERAEQLGRWHADDEHAAEFLDDGMTDEQGADDDVPAYGHQPTWAT